ncbi:palmitylated EEV envelope protein [Squirrelpox virus]|uniref:A6L n=2 Tax=Squirrelpox virus TaxID=240426 RepID=Q1HTT8_9POXV|nr:palmitylated EEV envelope protein [Squirrelpox virus]ABD51448.1 A6L [Squirrelpox virus]CCD83197.1 palmitylated EEV envelope protein [Squirrelpox virus]
MWSFFSKPPPGAGCRVVETIPPGSSIQSQHLNTLECFDEIITRAKKYIYIASYCCNLRSTSDGEHILNRLMEAAQNKISVIILVDDQSRDKDRADLTSAGVNYRKIHVGKKLGTGSLLGSFWVSDDERWYAGSASLTGGSISTIKTLGLYSEYAPLARDLRRRFETFSSLGERSESSWLSCMGKCMCCVPLSTAYHMHHPVGGIFFSDAPERLLGYSRTLDADSVLGFIESATTSIDMELLSIVPLVRKNDTVKYWPDIYNAIITAAIDRKVRVRLLVGLWRHNDVFSMAAARSIQEFGVGHADVSVRVFSMPGGVGDANINNTKLMVVDGTKAHVTVANFDGTQHLQYAFVSVNSVDPGVSKELADVFERDWNSPYSTPLPASK